MNNMIEIYRRTRVAWFENISTDPVTPEFVLRIADGVNLTLAETAQLAKACTEVAYLAGLAKSGESPAPVAPPAPKPAPGATPTVLKTAPAVDPTQAGTKCPGVRLEQLYNEDEVKELLHIRSPKELFKALVDDCLIMSTGISVIPARGPCVSGETVQHLYEIQQRYLSAGYEDLKGLVALLTEKGKNPKGYLTTEVVQRYLHRVEKIESEPGAYLARIPGSRVEKHQSRNLYRPGVYTLLERFSETYVPQQRNNKKAQG